MCVCVCMRANTHIGVHTQFVLKQEKPSTEPQPVKSDKNSILVRDKVS